MKSVVSRAVCLAAFAAISLPIAAAPKIDTQDLGPADPEARYVVSPTGVRLAIVARRGSRMGVTVDGEAGPRVDEIITPQVAWVDPVRFREDGRKANTVPGNVRTPMPVTFSSDGKRYAYLARIGQEYIIFADGKELVKLPPLGNAGNTSNMAEARLEFTGDDGKHLLFARNSFEGFELWVDGKRWPGTYASGMDPIVSPDGGRIAYVATMAPGKQTLIVDGKDAGYLGLRPQFMPDGRHIVSITPSPKGETILLDGKPLGTARQVLSVHLPQTGVNRIAAVLPKENPGGAPGYFLIVDNKPVPTTLSPDQITDVVFSPDGKHYAAVCGKAGAQFVVIDGKKGQEYQSIVAGHIVNVAPMGAMRFSPDSSKLVYGASAARKNFLIINEEELDAAFDSPPSFTFSADGKRIAFNGAQNSQQNPGVFIDGKPERLSRHFDLSTFAFSPDGTRYVYTTGIPRDGGPIYADGKDTQLVGKPMFSPDGKYLAAAAYRATDQKHGIYVNGTLVYASDAGPNIRYRAFSPDSQHLYWIAMEAAKGPQAKPGEYKWVSYLDGVEVAQFDRVQIMEHMFGGNLAIFLTVPPGWQVAPDGKLVCVGPVGDVMKRVTVTPDADTSIEKMLAKAGTTPR